MHIAYTFYDRPNYTAGPRINALRLLPELKRRGHRVSAIVGYHGSCPAKDILERQGVTVYELCWCRYTEDQIDLLRNALVDCNPDAYVPNISTSGCFAARFLRDAGRPTVAGHLSNDDYNWGMAERFCRAGDEWATSALFCMGRELGDIVRGWRPARTRVVDICHGVPMPEETAKVEGSLRLVFSGRLEDRQKRIMDVVSAISKVLSRYPDAQAKLIGDGSRREDVQAFFEKHDQAHRVEITGFVSPDTVQSLMQWGNTLILLSDFEGVPGAVMDGMAVGLVPVCLDIDGGLRELVVHGSTGLLVHDRDDDFQNTINRLHSDISLRKELAANARSHIAKGFSLEVAADRWEALLESLMAEAGPRKPIRFPRNYGLPEPHPQLASEDLRRPPTMRPSLRQRASVMVPEIAKRVIRKVAASTKPRKPTNGHDG